MLITNLVNLYVKKLNAAGINNSLGEIRLMIQETLKIDLAWSEGFSYNQLKMKKLS